MRAARGQAVVELVALLPVLLACAFAAYAVLAAGAAREAARAAAEAGAVAVLQEREPAASARDALPPWARRRASVRVARGAVRVTVRPRLPLPALVSRLTADATVTLPRDLRNARLLSVSSVSVRGGEGAGERP